MQGRQHQVTCHGGTDTDFDRFGIAHLTHHDNVWILAQRGAQYARKGKPDPRINLHLADSIETIFDRVLDRDDLGFLDV